MTISTGERTLLRKNTERISGWVFDASRQAAAGDAHATTTATPTSSASMPTGSRRSTRAACSRAAARSASTRTATRVYIVDQQGRRRPDAPHALRSGRRARRSSSNPIRSKQVDFGDAVFSELTDELVATAYEDERTRVLLPATRRSRPTTAPSRRSCPARRSTSARRRPTSSLWLVSASSDTEPGERYLFDRKTKALTLQYRVFEKLPREALAPMTAITLHVVGRPGDPRVSDAAERRRRRRTCR